MIPEPHVFVQELQDPQGSHVQSSESQHKIILLKLSKTLRPWQGLIMT